jgi:hypothetical protein
LPGTSLAISSWQRFESNVAGRRTFTAFLRRRESRRYGNAKVQVNPLNPGTVTVHVFLAQSPGGTPLDQTFQVTSSSPLNQSWTLQPALYAVAISWQSGYQNIAALTAGNAIIVNGTGLYYQVLGSPGDANGISGMFGAQVT